jgi:ABC-type transport system involved in multi-copper enzyme maturation permease subunit
MFGIPGSPNWLALGLAGLVLLVVLVVLGFLVVGLFQARSLLRREFSTWFLSPVAWVVLVVFLFVTGSQFNAAFDLLTTTGPEGTESPLQTMFSDQGFWLVFLLIPPLLTMRLFAEERSSGTLEMLMTAPLRDWQVVLCKYLACLAFYVVLWLPTVVYLPVLLGAQPPLLSPAVTPWSLLLLSGLAVLLVGLALLLVRLGTLGRVVSVLLLLAGAGLAGVGGWLHYTLDTVHLVSVPAGGWQPLLAPGVTRWSILLLSGLAVLLVGLVLLLPRLGTPARVVSLVVVLAGLNLIGVGGWMHYRDDPVHLIEIPILFDPAPALATYLGVFLAGAMFLSLGLLVSSLVRDQMVAALLALALGLVFVAAGFSRPEQYQSWLDQDFSFLGFRLPFDRTFLDSLIYFFSVPLHFTRAFTRGIIDTRPIVLYISTTLFCLFLTVRSLESRRWQ